MLLLHENGVLILKGNLLYRYKIVFIFCYILRKGKILVQNFTAVREVN